MNTWAVQDNELAWNKESLVEDHVQNCLLIVFCDRKTERWYEWLDIEEKQAIATDSDQEKIDSLFYLSFQHQN